MRCQRDQDIRQDIGRDEIIFLRPDLLLYFLIVNEISEDHLEFSGVNAVRAQIVLDGRRCAGIQIRSHCAPDSQHQCQNSEDPASGPHIQHIRLRRQVFPDLADTELRRLMHASPEGCAGIDVEDQCRLFVCDLRFFPGRDRQYVVDPELMEILFPVVDPVQVLRLLDDDRALTDLRIGPQHRELIEDLGLHLFRCLGLVVHKDMPVLSLLQKEAEHSCPVVFSGLRQDIHEHLLLFRRRQRDVVLDLRAVQADVLHGTDDNILRL